MKAPPQMKSRASSRLNNGNYNNNHNSTQQAIFELKHKVVLALNKLGDRDTCQIGVDELERTAEGLTPDGIAPFLSCILDTDKEQKSAVRKECVRLVGTLVGFHGCLVGPHLAKVVASIVRRLKDPDTVVRDACVETMGVLASRLGDRDRDRRGDENDGVFVVLVKPLFEALGEQNKQMQSGSALCLARVIDHAHDPPILILQRMLTRTIKLLKNPHFMAKPALIELNRSIIQAGGATTRSVLSAAISSIQEALKNNDWITRKAASVALGEIASSGASCLGSYKASCTRALESCRFDKVKPVRDSVLHALHYWKSLSGPDTTEHSETGSSIKGDFSDLNSTSDSVQKDVRLDKVMTDSTKRIPLSIKRTCQNYLDSQHSKEDDWHIEIAVPKTRSVSLADEESEGSYVAKALERMSTDITCTPDMRCKYVPIEDKQDCSSVTNLVSESFGTKFVTVSRDFSEEGSLLNPVRRNHKFSAEEIDNEERIYCTEIQDRQSLDSTVTGASSRNLHGCCSQVASEMLSIQKQLLDIENKQSNLMELLQVFSTGIMDSLSVLQSKFSGLEHEVERITNIVMHGGRHSDSAISKLMKQNQTVSPRLSTCTPRPSVDVNSGQPSFLSSKNPDIWEVKSVLKSKSANPAKHGTEMRSNPTVYTRRNVVGKDMIESSGQGPQSLGQTRKFESVFASVSSANARQNAPEGKNNLRQRVKGFLCKGDLDSAFREALCSGDELVLIELFDVTGPVLESLSNKNVSGILSVLASCCLEQRFTNSIIPWLQQVVDLSTIHGPDFLALSAKTRRELMSAIQEAVNMEFCNPAERRSFTQLATKVHQLWG